MKVRAEDPRQVQTVINGVTYSQNRGYFEMPDHHARAHLNSANLPTPAAALPVGRSGGYRCTSQACGFGSFFTTCGRCQAPCVRE